MKNLYLLLVVLIVASVGCGKPPNSRESTPSQSEKDPGDRGRVIIGKPQTPNGGNGLTPEQIKLKKKKDACKVDPFSHTSNTDKDDNCFCLLNGVNDESCACTITELKKLNPSLTASSCDKYSATKKNEPATLCMIADITKTKKDMHNCECSKPENKNKKECLSDDQVKNCSQMCDLDKDKRAKFIQDHNMGAYDCDNDNLTNQQELDINQDLSSSICSSTYSFICRDSGYKETDVESCSTKISAGKSSPNYEVKIGSQTLDALDLCEFDTDKDGLSDGDEVKDKETNPLAYDTDSDCLSDKDEIFNYHTNPKNPITDKLSSTTENNSSGDSGNWIIRECDSWLSNGGTSGSNLIRFVEENKTDKFGEPVGMKLFIPPGVAIDQGTAIANLKQDEHVKDNPKFKDELLLDASNISSHKGLNYNAHAIPLSYGSKVFAGVIYYDYFSKGSGSAPYSSPQALSGYITEKLKGLFSSSSFTSYAGTPFDTHDQMKAVLNTYTVINTDSSQSAKKIRDKIYNALTGVDISSLNTIDSTASKRSSDEFTIRLSIIQRPDSVDSGQKPFIVSFAVTPKMTDNNSDSIEGAEIKAKDLVNTTGVARLDSTLKTTCIYSRTSEDTPKVYFYIVLDESGSMHTVNKNVSASLGFFLKRVARANVDYRLGISPIIPISDASSRPNICGQLVNGCGPSVGDASQGWGAGDRAIHQFNGGGLTNIDGTVVMPGWTQNSTELATAISYITSNSSGNGERGLFMALNGIPAMRTNTTAHPEPFAKTAKEIGAPDTIHVKIDASDKAETKIMAIIISDEKEGYFDSLGTSSSVFQSKMEDAAKAFNDRDVTVFTVTSPKNSGDYSPAYDQIATATGGIHIDLDKRDDFVGVTKIKDGLAKIIDKASEIASPIKIVGYNPISASFSLKMNDVEVNNAAKTACIASELPNRCPKSPIDPDCQKSVESTCEIQNSILANSGSLVDRSIVNGYDYNPNNNALQLYGHRRVPEGQRAELVYKFKYFVDDLKNAE